VALPRRPRLPSSPPRIRSRRSSDLHDAQQMGGVGGHVWTIVQKQLHGRQLPLCIPQRSIAHHQSIENKFHGLSPAGQTVTTSLRSEEHTSELQSRENLVCRLLLAKK